MAESDDWTVFQRLNARRRAIRDFDGKPIDENALREVLALSLVVPILSLLPIGPSGTRQWTARNSIFAAQALLLAAAARGFDTCPMEGFDAARVGRLLALPRGSVIPVIVAIGHRVPDATVEPQLRRPFSEAVVVH